MSRLTIEFWDPDLLRYLPNLEVLCLQDMISDIPNNFFKHSSKLKSLEMVNVQL